MADKPKFRIFGGRRKKDEAGLKKAKEEGGSYTVRSRKIDSPKGGGKLKKGSTVTFKHGTPLKISTSTKGEFATGTKKTPKTVYERQDWNEKDPKKGPRGAQTRKTVASDFAKQYNENPEKAKAREVAQANEQDTYYYKGKHELSGRHVTKNESTPNLGYKTKTKATVTGGDKPSVSIKRPAKKKSVAGIALNREAGSDRKGRGQNYMKLKVRVGRKADAKTVLKYKTKTKRTKRPLKG